MNNTVTREGFNLADMLNENQSLVVQYLMHNGGCSRSEIAKAIGLTQASITKIVATLIHMGIIEETGVGKIKNGHRIIEIRLRSEQFLLVGVKLARTSFAVGLFDLLGKQYEVESQSLRIGQGPETVMNQIERAIQTLQAKYDNIIAVGVSVPGPFLREKGIIAKMTECPGWESFNIRDNFDINLDLPVFIEHDANAGALAEWWFGEENCNVLVHLLVSDGVGAGIIENGKLLLGTDGVAGEIGHMSIAFDGRKCQCSAESRGCVEQYCSALSFVRDVQERLLDYPQSSLNQLENITANDVFKAANAGDAYAIEMVETVATYLGIAIANVVNIYNPDCIIISGIMAKGGQRLLNRVRQTVQSRVFPPLFEKLRIKLCDPNYDPVLVGAAAVALNQFLNHPASFVKQTTHA